MNKHNLKPIIILPITITAFFFGLFLPVQNAFAGNIPLLIKSPNDNAIYFVSESLNAKKLINSETVFLSYGDKWEWVKTVPQSTIQSYRDVRLVKTSDSNNVYYIFNGAKRLVPSPEVFKSLGFNWNEILTINQIDLDSYRPEAPLGAGMSISGDSQIATSHLAVSLVDEQLPTVVVPDNVWFNFTKIKFTATGNQPIFINGLTINLYGLNNGDQQIGEIYLTDINDRPIGQPQIFRGRRATFNLASEPIMIPAGQSQIIKVWTSAKLPNIYVGFGLETADFIYTTAQISGQFPIKGYQYRIVDRTGLAGQATIEALEISSQMREVVIGADNQIITKFRILETSQQQNILLKKIILTAKGNFDNDNLTNIDLVDERNRVLATAPQMIGGQVIFDLSAKPLKIEAGRFATVSVRGDFKGGRDQSLQLVINSQNDLWLENEESGWRLLAQNDFPVGLTGGTTFNKVKPVSRPASLYASYSGQTGDIVAGSRDAKLGAFTIKATGEELEFNGFALKINRGGQYPLIGHLIVKLNGETIADYYARDFADKFNRINFEKDVRLTENRTYQFEILGSVDDRASNLDSYQLTFANFNLRNDNHDYFGDNLEINSPTIRVKTVEAKITLNNKYESFAVIADRDKQLIGSFNLAVGAAEDVEITSASIANLSGNYFYDKLYLKIGNRLVATLDNPLSSPHIFTLTKPYKLSRGKTYQLNVYADIAPDAHGDQTALSVVDLTLAGKNSQVAAELTNLPLDGQPILSLVSSIDLNQEPTNTTIVAGEKNQSIAKLTITNNSAEKVKIKEIYVYQTPDSDEFSYDSGFSNLQLVLSDNQRKRIGKKVSKPIFGGNNLGGFNLNPFESLTLNLMVDTSLAAGNKTIELTIQDIIGSGYTSKQNLPINVSGDSNSININHLD